MTGHAGSSISATFAGPAHGLAGGVLFGALLLAACVSDLRTRRIPNALVGGILLLGLSFSVMGAPWPSSGLRAIAALGVGFVIWVPFYSLRLIGAGDVKFFAAASTWLGVSSAVQAALLSALFGALLSVIWMAATGGWRLVPMRIVSTWRQPLAVADRTRTPGSGPAPAHRMPYGVAMAAGLAASVWLVPMAR